MRPEPRETLLTPTSCLLRVVWCRYPRQIQHAKETAGRFPPTPGNLLAENQMIPNCSSHRLRGAGAMPPWGGLGLEGNIQKFGGGDAAMLVAPLPEQDRPRGRPRAVLTSAARYARNENARVRG